MSEKRVDEVDLRKCPLCGCDAVYTYEDGHGTNSGEKSNYVSCGYNDCMPEPICFHYDVWQNRPIEAKLQAELSTARAEIEKLRSKISALIDGLSPTREITPQDEVDILRKRLSDARIAITEDTISRMRDRMGELLRDNDMLIHSVNNYGIHSNLSMLKMIGYAPNSRPCASFVLQTKSTYRGSDG